MRDLSQRRSPVSLSFGWMRWSPQTLAPFVKSRTAADTPQEAHQALAYVVVEGDEKIAGCGTRECRAHLGGELGAHALVGIDLEYPLAAASLDAGHPPRPLD